MRIILSPYSLRRGGAERVVLELARGFLQRGHDALVAPWVDIDEHPESRYRDIPRQFLSAYRDYKWPRSALSAARAFGEIVDRFRPDVIALHDPAICWPVSLASPAVPTLHVLHGHGWLSPPVSRKKRLIRVIDRLLYRRLRPHLAVVSQTMAEPAARHYRISPADISTLPNGIDVARFGERERRPGAANILLVGTINANKGQLMAIDAFERLSAMLPEARLTIAGDGPDLAALRSRAAASSEHSRIRILGRREDVPALMAEAAVLWQLSRSEAHPLTILEAMAASVPVVGFDVEGVRDTIANGSTGFLVPYGDLDALKNRTSQLLHNPVLQGELVREAQQLVRNDYSLDAMIDRHEHLLQMLCADRGATHKLHGSRDGQAHA